MASNRIFYACQSVSLGGNVLTGVQSVGLNTNFAFDQVFQLGQIEIYENLEGIPDVGIPVDGMWLGAIVGALVDGTIDGVCDGTREGLE